MSKAATPDEVLATLDAPALPAAQTLCEQIRADAPPAEEITATPFPWG